MRALGTRVALGVAMAGLLAAPAATADSKVRGKVRDGDGKPIAEAQVTIRNTASGQVYKLKTGKDGAFYQRGVLPASYSLKVECLGYTAHIVEDIVVQAGVERSFDLTLRSLAQRQAELLKEQGLQNFSEGADAFNQGDFEAALAKAEGAIADHPEDAKGYDLKAKALISLKRYAEAIPFLEKELTLPNPLPDARQALVATTYNAGVMASRKDQTDEAIGYLEKAIVLGHADALAHRLLGDAYLQKGDFAKVREHLEAYLAKDPGAADAEKVRQLLSEIQKLEQKK